MNWLNFVFSFLLLVFMPLPNSAAKEEDPVASSRTVFLSRLSLMMFAMVVMGLLITMMMMMMMMTMIMMVVMLMMMVAGYGDQRKSQW